MCALEEISRAPNLNLIERFWKFTKGELRTKYYDQFEVFKEKIDSIISSSTKENKGVINSLIGEKVQLFDDFVPTNKKAELLDGSVNRKSFISNEKSRGKAA